jgi:hypothetical protein
MGLLELQVSVQKENDACKPGTVVTTIHFLHNLQMCKISWSVFHWQASPALHNVTL